MARKDFAAMERDRPSGVHAARAAMRSRMAHPTRLRVEELQPNPRNPRYAGDDPEVQEVAATLGRVGQLQPALVITREGYASAYPNEHLGPEPWVVIVGNRRLAACRIAGRPMLDVRVAEELDADAIEDRVLVENLQRQNLPPLLEAEALQRRLDRSGETLRSVAATIGKTHTYVAQRVALLKLVPELQELLRDGRISIRHGRELGVRPVEEQRAVAAELVGMSDDEVRTFLAVTGGGNRVSNTGQTNQPAREDDDGAEGRGNRVSTGRSGSRRGGGVGRQSAPAGGGLEGARVAAAQWLDNAVKELDQVLPAGGDTGPGRRLAEARRLIEQARSLLSADGD